MFGCNFIDCLFTYMYLCTTKNLDYRILNLVDVKVKFYYGGTLQYFLDNQK